MRLNRMHLPRCSAEKVSCEKFKTVSQLRHLQAYRYFLSELHLTNRMIKPKQKVVIVGAGPGGLAAAILLQRSGVDVTVVERREVVGGRTSTMEQNGFKFDTGPTFFLYPRVLREIFAAAGRDLDEEIPMYRLDPQYRLVFGSGGELLATPDLERMERAIAQLSPEDARGFHRFFCDNRNKLEKFMPFLERPSKAGEIWPSSTC